MTSFPLQLNMKMQHWPNVHQGNNYEAITDTYALWDWARRHGSEIARAWNESEEWYASQ
jgi:hypothetical protein